MRESPPPPLEGVNAARDSYWFLLKKITLPHHPVSDSGMSDAQEEALQEQTITNTVYIVTDESCNNYMLFSPWVMYGSMTKLCSLHGLLTDVFWSFPTGNLVSRCTGPIHIRTMGHKEKMFSCPHCTFFPDLKWAQWVLSAQLGVPHVLIGYPQISSTGQIVAPRAISGQENNRGGN